MFFVYSNLYNLYIKSKNLQKSADNIGIEMILENLKQAPGFTGFEKPAEKGQYAIDMLCYTKDSDVFQFLKPM